MVTAPFCKERDMNTLTKARDLRGDQVSNGGEDVILSGQPYLVDVEITGVCPILFHKWDCDAVEAQSKAAKGSKAKKTDNTETYLYRNAKGEICLPGEYLRQSIIGASKFRQDPRSPRKSAMDLFKAGLVSMTDMAGTGLKNPDYYDRRRVLVQRNAITRTRPALDTGWKAKIEFAVLLGEYITEPLLREVLSDAGRFVGVGDFRPTFGRFTVTGFKAREAA